MGLLLLIALGACSRFGTGSSASSGTLPDASIDAEGGVGERRDGGRVREGGTPPGCSLITFLDFEDQRFPPSGFESDTTLGSVLVVSPSTDVAGGHALRATAKADKGTASLATEYKVPSATKRIRLSFAFRIDSYPFGNGSTYTEPGCDFVAEDGGESVHLRLERNNAGLLFDSVGNEASEPGIDLTAAANTDWHRILIEMSMEAGAFRAHVELDDVDRGSTLFGYPTTGFQTKTIVLRCGVPYTERLTQDFTTEVDDVSLELCE